MAGNVTGGGAWARIVTLASSLLLLATGSGVDAETVATLSTSPQDEAAVATVTVPEAPTDASVGCSRPEHPT